MKNSLMALIVGLGIGVYVGYASENQIDAACYQSKRMKKQMMRKFHDLQNYLD